MKRLVVLWSALLLTGYIFAQSLSPEESYKKLQELAIIDQKVMMPMRDGIRLATDIFRPKGDQKVPIIFSRTPYNFNTWGDGEQKLNAYASALEAVKRGYAYVVQNERGRFFSEGEWDILGTPLTDGYDALTWLSTQSWSNGKIGLTGCSSTAEWQMAVTSIDHPALAANITQAFGAGVGRIGKFYEQGNWYRGGAHQLLFTSWLYGTQHDIIRPQLPKNATQEDLLRIQRFYDMAPEYPKVDWTDAFTHLPVQDIIKDIHGPVSVFEDLIRRKPNDPAWYQGGLYHDNMPYEKPTFWFASWYDVSTSPNLAMINHIKKNAKKPGIADNQYLVIAPVLHCSYKRATENTMVGERNVGDARLDYDALTYGWFDYWMKGEKNDILTKTPKVQFYTMGSNKWQASDTWPPSGYTTTTYYLHSSGKANSVFGDGKLSPNMPSNENPDQFSYDPNFPVPSNGGNVCCMGNALNGGAYDQRQMEARNDILVYTSDPLVQGVEVTGSIEATVFVSSDAKDTDVTLKILDVYPDGKAYNLDETIQRLRYRDGYDKEVMMEKGKVYKVDLTPISTSNYFAPGHSIRIEISSSNFPRFDRNLNTGGNNYNEYKGVIAKNTIHHSSVYSSQVRMPVKRY
ncbi:MAG: CocE/NonD family hydrolase [Saprospiraceae bacterium]|nr:CocE/NonD family hydrolase [Saprospiraceae bacterium]